MPRGLGGEEGASPWGATRQLYCARLALPQGSTEGPGEGLSVGTAMRGAQGPHLHQEAEGPAGLVLQDSELHTRCGDGKVPVRHTGPSADSLPGLLPRVPAGAGLGTGAVVAETRCPSGAQEATAGLVSPHAAPTFPAAALSCPPARQHQSLRTLHGDRSCVSGRWGRVGRASGTQVALFCKGGTGLFPQNGRGMRRGAAALLASQCQAPGQRPAWEPTVPLACSWGSQAWEFPRQKVLEERSRS